MDVHANQVEMFGLSKEADLSSHKLLGNVANKCISKRQVESVHVKERCLRTSTFWVTEKKA